ncbi:hypothetical protein GA0115240_15489 [Streptomyces sp. DvalAA-14]|uniref:hypothetical protein n=1 Tax=unclassified Streptomyces TaxID=2593676 RepID=UPI00081B0B0A|nr:MULTISPECIES: hypothetical protein [unclassified Streptomyces]MYS23673.1 hypothetical protein [Streptomyces sp. SID4948]SCE37001.1 hypothetical protein GA0115240_15489 [Streptomyces sp. DvalAA-14]
MSDRAALFAAVERLAGRLRALPQRRLQAGAAGEGLALARWLAGQAQLLEFPGREPHQLPDDGIFVVGDQLAVAGHELAMAVDRERDPERVAGVLREARERAADAARAIG